MEANLGIDAGSIYYDMDVYQAKIYCNGRWESMQGDLIPYSLCDFFNDIEWYQTLNGISIEWNQIWE